MVFVAEEFEGKVVPAASSMAKERIRSAREREFMTSSVGFVTLPDILFDARQGQRVAGRGGGAS